MDVLVENDGKVYMATSIDDPSAFTSPFPGSLFACLIWDNDGRFTDAARSTLPLVAGDQLIYSAENFIGRAV